MHEGQWETPKAQLIFKWATASCSHRSKDLCSNADIKGSNTTAEGRRSSNRSCLQFTGSTIDYSLRLSDVTQRLASVIVLYEWSKLKLLRFPKSWPLRGSTIAAKHTQYTRVTFLLITSKVFERFSLVVVPEISMIHFESCEISRLFIGRARTATLTDDILMRYRVSKSKTSKMRWIQS